MLAAREYAGAAGFLLNETSPSALPPLLVACETPLEHLAHADLTTHAIATPPLSLREWYRKRKLAKETQMANAPATKATAKAPATPSATPEPPNFTQDVEAAAERFNRRVSACSS
ncbi:hypothetical protein ACVWWN_000270 [Mycobacterium sp. URHB0021]